MIVPQPFKPSNPTQKGRSPHPHDQHRRLLRRAAIKCRRLLRRAAIKCCVRQASLCFGHTTRLPPFLSSTKIAFYGILFLLVLALTEGLLRSGHGTYQAYGNFSLFPYMKTSFGWIFGTALLFPLSLAPFTLLCPTFESPGV